MSTSSNTPPPRVVVARSELQQCVDHITAMQRVLDAILQRPEPQPIQRDEGGWPKLGWEAHDDPTYTGREVPPVEGLHDSRDDL